MGEHVCCGSSYASAQPLITASGGSPAAVSARPLRSIDSRFCRYWPREDAQLEQARRMGRALVALRFRCPAGLTAVNTVRGVIAVSDALDDHHRTSRILWESGLGPDGALDRLRE